MSRLAACRRAETDLKWRAALGLPVGRGGNPTEKTVREFESWLQARSPKSDVPRYLLVHEHIVRLLLVEQDKPVLAMDSTPMWCFGALRGTLRLLADGVRSLVRRAIRTARNPLDLANEVDRIPWLKSKSTKGGIAIDWRDANARAEVVHEVAKVVIAMVEMVKPMIPTVSAYQARRLHERCEALLQVIASDLVQDEDGRLVIARKVARDRIVSITDPEARSSRKTQSQPFKGFKIHVLGDLQSRVLVSVDVYAANAPEGPAGHRLILQARRLLGEKLDTVLADTAYGGTEVREKLADIGVDLHAPPHRVPHSKNGRFMKHNFNIDFDRGVATCPTGVASTRTQGTKPLRFVWERSDCKACKSAGQCLSTGELQSIAKPERTKGRRRMNGHVLRLNPNERALRRARETWSSAGRQQAYKRRAECELLVAMLVRHGARKARAFGLEAAKLQVHAIAIRTNLGTLARALHHQTTTD